MKPITPCLWFDRQAEEAAAFYTTVFGNSKIGNIARYGPSGAEVSGQPLGSVMTVAFELSGMPFLGLNGGPHFQFSPSLSFFVSCETLEEIENKWNKLSVGGEARMNLDRYPWAEKYGWIKDRYGVDWQLILAPAKDKIVPSFLFVQNLFGRGEEALQFYLSIFPNSKIQSMARDESTKTVMHCSFTLNGQGFVLMEGQGPHAHTFTNATSLIVNCETQEQIDHYWSKLSEGGTIEQCGWLKDKYGVSWQITPAAMEKMTTDSDPQKTERMMKAMFQMKKIDLAKLQQAFEG